MKLSKISLRGTVVVSAAMLITASSIPLAYADTEFKEAEDLFALPLEKLMDIKVTSVSKKEQPVKHAPAAIAVITSEDIRRMGVTSVPEALRGVPGIHVARIDSNKWAISSRGFTTQFTPNLLVMVDGRTIYNPIFSGVWWDTHDLLLEDVDRIEVIRGPGATLWGANAVNGVINIITKPASQTRGAYASAYGGNYEYGGEARYGGSTQGGWDYRVYGKRADRSSFDTVGNFSGLGSQAGMDNQDDWDHSRAGFRAEGALNDQLDLMVQGDLYHGNIDSPYNRPAVTAPYFSSQYAEDDISGGFLLSRWNYNASETSDLSLQLYADATNRNEALAGFEIRTYDADLQHNYRINERNELVWGLGYRYIEMKSDGNNYVRFSDEDSSVDLYSAFVQNEYQIVPDTWSVIAGTKLEHNDYTGLNVQPSLKSVWNVNDRNTVWGSVSRAVRTPNLVQDSVSVLTQPIAAIPPVTVAPGVTVPALIQINGSPAVKDEVMLAYELGHRAEVTDAISVDSTVFYNDYSDGLTIESSAPALTVDPLLGGAYLSVPNTFSNLGEAKAYGFETMANWQVMENWRLSASYSLMQLNTDTKPGSNDVSYQALAGNTTNQMYSFGSNVNLLSNVEMDNMLYYVDDLKVSHYSPGAYIESYLRFDTRVAWRPMDYLELSLVGQNLLDDSHQEFGAPLYGNATEVPRTFFGRVTVRY